MLGLPGLSQPEEDQVRIVVIQGSARHEDSCPDQWGKTRRLVQRAIEDPPEGVEFDVIDLAVKGDGNIVQPCKSCVSTSGGFHCHWACSCYSKNSRDLPDFMHNENIYDRLQKADGFVVFTPINWYGPSSVVKSFFDRLVCANLTLTVEDAARLTGDDIKNSEKTRALEKGGKHGHLLKNHLEGKFAAFFAHGDDGGADYREVGTPEARNSPAMPDSYKDKLVRTEARASEGPVNGPEHAVLPLVWQCRYSGINVPDDLVGGMHINRGFSYASGNDRAAKDARFLEAGRALVHKLVAYCAKGSVNGRGSPTG